MVTLLLILIAIAAVWLACFMVFNDLLIPVASMKKYKNVLFIFAHMDDETVLAGGLMAKSVAKGRKVTLLTLTQGEKGNDGRVADPRLPAVRKAELARVLAILGVKNLIHLTYPDETLTTRKAALNNDIRRAIKRVQPDLVVTFDLHGWYGHYDHTACAEAVTYVVKKEHKKIDLWYAVRPEAVNRAARLVHRVLRPGGAPLTPRTKPTHRVLTGIYNVLKIRALYQYNSQMSALRPGVTVGPIPMWFFMSTQPFDYIVKT